MPSELVRADRVLMHYMARKADDLEQDSIEVKTILRDVESIQEKSGVHLYEILSLDGRLKSPELEEELVQLQGQKKIERTPNGVRPLGMGRLSGGFLELPAHVEEAINETINRKAVDTHE